MAVSADFSKWTVNLLKEECGKLGLKKSGKKSELVARYVLLTILFYFLTSCGEQVCVSICRSVGFSSPFIFSTPVHSLNYSLVCICHID